MAAEAKLARVYRLTELPAFVGLGSTQIDEMIAAGTFPKPFRPSPGGRVVVWAEDELLAWQAGRRASRDTEEERALVADRAAQLKQKLGAKAAAGAKAP